MSLMNINKPLTTNFLETKSNNEINALHSKLHNETTRLSTRQAAAPFIFSSRNSFALITASTSMIIATIFVAILQINMSHLSSRQPSDDTEQCQAQAKQKE